MSLTIGQFFGVGIVCIILWIILYFSVGVFAQTISRLWYEGKMAVIIKYASSCKENDIPHVINFRL